MAFTGTAVIVQIADNLFRITGLSLGAGDSGTIGLSANSGAEVKVPASWDRYKNAHGEQIELDQSVQVDVIKAEAALATTKEPSVVKSGDGPSDFLATIANPDAAASGAMEIYVRYH